MNKKEYISKLKRLLKKYHPDLCNNKSMEKINNEITIKLNNILNQTRTENSELIHSPENNCLLNTNSQSYEYYKLGIGYYKNIHPDQFYNMNIDRTYETKTFEEQFEILNKIFISFNIAEYYFNKVIKDYPNSEWTEDAKEKIKYLKKLYKSYENFDIENNNQIINNSKYVSEMGLNIL